MGFELKILLITGLMAVAPNLLQPEIPLLNGIVLDENHEPLSNVKIINVNHKDTITIYNDDVGRFKFHCLPDTKLYFFKKGYLNGFIKYPEVHNDLKIILKQNQASDSIRLYKFDSNITPRITKILIDSINIPKDEWNDINPEYIRETDVYFPPDGEAHIIMKF